MRWGGLSIRPTLPEDAADLAPRVRPADIEELRVTVGKGPEAAIRESVALTDTPFTIVDVYGCPHAITGVSRQEDGSGCIWLLGSMSLEQNPRAFASLTRDTYRCVSERYPYVWNAVDTRRTDTRRWLRWLGFVEMWTVPAPLDPSVDVVGVVYVRCLSSRRSRADSVTGLLRDATTGSTGREEAATRGS